jgi:hypothetical protein
MVSAIKSIKRVFSQNAGASTGGGGSSTPNVQTVTSAATVTPTFTNDEVAITAQAAALLLANPTGTPVDGKNLVIRIKDNGTAQAITYDTEYRAIGVTLPTTTVINKTIYLGLVYNLTDTKWDVVGVSIEGADSLYDSGWIDYSATSTVVGWSSTPTKQLSYRILGKQMFVMFSFIGTSNSTTVTFTIPNDSVGTNTWTAFGYAVNNGASTGAGLVQRASANTIVCYRDSIGNAWTASGTKRISGEFFIEIA